MLKTTVYFPARLKRRLRAFAARAKKSEAAVIREAVERLVERPSARRPTLPLFYSGQPGLARHVDDVLREERFGEEGLRR